MSSSPSGRFERIVLIYNPDAVKFPFYLAEQLRALGAGARLEHPPAGEQRDERQRERNPADRQGRRAGRRQRVGAVDALERQQIGRASRRGGGGSGSACA